MALIDAHATRLGITRHASVLELIDAGLLRRKGTAPMDKTLLARAAEINRERAPRDEINIDLIRRAGAAIEPQSPEEAPQKPTLGSAVTFGYTRPKYGGLSKTEKKK